MDLFGRCTRKQQDEAPPETAEDTPVLLWLRTDLVVAAGGSSASSRLLFGRSVDDVPLQSLVVEDFNAVHEACNELQGSGRPCLLPAVAISTATAQGTAVHRDLCLALFPGATTDDTYILLTVGGSRPSNLSTQQPCPPVPQADSSSSPRSSAVVLAEVDDLHIEVHPDVQVSRSVHQAAAGVWFPLAPSSPSRHEVPAIVPALAAAAETSHVSAPVPGGAETVAPGVPVAPHEEVAAESSYVSAPVLVIAEKFAQELPVASREVPPAPASQVPAPVPGVLESVAPVASRGVVAAAVASHVPAPVPGVPIGQEGVEPEASCGVAPAVSSHIPAPVPKASDAVESAKASHLPAPETGVSRVEENVEPEALRGVMPVTAVSSHVPAPVPDVSKNAAPEASRRVMDAVSSHVPGQVPGSEKVVQVAPSSPIQHEEATKCGLPAWHRPHPDHIIVSSPCGAAIVVPAPTMALIRDQNLEFRVEEVEPRCPIEDGMELAGPVLQLSPAGVSFSQELKLVMPLYVVACGEHSDFKFFVLEEEDSKWREVPGGDFSHGQGQVAVRRFCQMTVLTKLFPFFRVPSQETYNLVVRTYVLVKDSRAWLPQGVYTGYASITCGRCLACQTKEEEWFKNMQRTAGDMIPADREQSRKEHPLALSRSAIKSVRLCRLDKDKQGAVKNYAFSPCSFTIMEVRLDFSQNLMQVSLSYDLEVMTKDPHPLHVVTVDFPNPQPDSVLVVVPADHPRRMDTLYASIREAIHICRRAYKYDVMTLVSTDALERELNKQQPDILFFCCHRVEEDNSQDNPDRDRIYLGRPQTEHLRSADFLDLFRRRGEWQSRHNPAFVVFSTCGGNQLHLGGRLPKALHRERVGVDFVVYWLGKAPDDVAALYSKLLINFLEKTALTKDPCTRYCSSHKEALAALPDAIEEMLREDPGSEEDPEQGRWLRSSWEQIQCYPDPDGVSRTPTVPWPTHRDGRLRPNSTSAMGKATDADRQAAYSHGGGSAMPTMPRGAASPQADPPAPVIAAPFGTQGSASPATAASFTANAGRPTTPSGAHGSASLASATSFTKNNVGFLPRARQPSGAQGSASSASSTSFANRQLIDLPREDSESTPLRFLPAIGAMITNSLQRFEATPSSDWRSNSSVDASSSSPSPMTNRMSLSNRSLPRPTPGGPFNDR